MASTTCGSNRFEPIRPEGRATRERPAALTRQIFGAALLLLSVANLAGTALLALITLVLLSTTGVEARTDLSTGVRLALAVTAGGGLLSALGAAALGWQAMRGRTVHWHAALALAASGLCSLGWLKV